MRGARRCDDCGYDLEQRCASCMALVCACRDLGSVRELNAAGLAPGIARHWKANGRSYLLKLKARRVR